MIVVCEPQCKSISHEKVNSGFIYGLRLAYPLETIRLYADASHIKALKEILIHDNSDNRNNQHEQDSVDTILGGAGEKWPTHDCCRYCEQGDRNNPEIHSGILLVKLND